MDLEQTPHFGPFPRQSTSPRAGSPVDRWEMSAPAPHPHTYGPISPSKSNRGSGGSTAAAGGNRSTLTAEACTMSSLLTSPWAGVPHGNVPTAASRRRNASTTSSKVSSAPSTPLSASNLLDTALLQSIDDDEDPLDHHSHCDPRPPTLTHWQSSYYGSDTRTSNGSWSIDANDSAHRHLAPETMPNHHFTDQSDTQNGHHQHSLSAAATYHPHTPHTPRAQSPSSPSHGQRGSAGTLRGSPASAASPNSTCNSSGSPVSGAFSTCVRSANALVPPKMDMIPCENEFDAFRAAGGADLRTTVMIRNIPNKYTQQMLIEYMNESHCGQYDFLYLRMDFKNRCNVGYAFCNFVSPAALASFSRRVVGQKWSRFNSDKVCMLSYANIQGRQALIDKFRNSAVMDEHASYRPKIFATEGPVAGTEQVFPPPTILRMPRMSASAMYHHMATSAAVVTASHYHPQSLQHQQHQQQQAPTANMRGTANKKQTGCVVDPVLLSTHFVDALGIGAFQPASGQRTIPFTSPKKPMMDQDQGYASRSQLWESDGASGLGGSVLATCPTVTSSTVLNVKSAPFVPRRMVASGSSSKV